MITGVVSKDTASIFLCALYRRYRDIPTYKSHPKSAGIEQQGHWGQGIVSSLGNT